MAHADDAIVVSPSVVDVRLGDSAAALLTLEDLRAAFDNAAALEADADLRDALGDLDADRL